MVICEHGYGDAFGGRNCPVCNPTNAEAPMSERGRKLMEKQAPALSADRLDELAASAKSAVEHGVTTCMMSVHAKDVAALIAAARQAEALAEALEKCPQYIVLAYRDAKQSGCDKTTLAIAERDFAAVNAALAAYRGGSDE